MHFCQNNSALPFLRGDVLESSYFDYFIFNSVNPLRICLLFAKALLHIKKKEKNIKKNYKKKKVFKVFFQISY